MTKLSTEQVRNTFIDFFKKNGHKHVPSSSLVPHNDPSLMFVNAGMVQFKDVFTGNEKIDYTRATSSQKSVRAGGKHNDLDNVGYTARHHTFFEMLGNFSFGDYFKEEAIYYAWNLLTQDFNLDKNKLYVTIYHNDDESAAYWKKIANFSDDRIIRINNSDNFWSMGSTGPCGPCSEIFYDHGESVAGGLPGTAQENGDRFTEIWNLVFMQFEQIDNDTRILLPQKCVDTGMGLERISAIIQNVHDNYDIDVFQDIINYTESILKVKASGDNLFSYRVIADHLRSSVFLIADGVMPSNEGRGYVLRRIMRRAIRHSHNLGAKEPLMHRLLPKLVDLFGTTYPEITRGEEFISSVLQQEEDRFQKTLGRGLKLLASESVNLPKGSVLSGEVAFKLYDTFGFPLDLTQDILKKQDVAVNSKEFNEHMNLQKERARKAWSGSGEEKTASIWFDVLSKFGATEFLGYSLDSAEAKIVALIQDNKFVQKISSKGQKFILISNQTVFYAESGGQAGDVGFINSSHCKIKVVNTLKYLGKIVAHICELESGEISQNEQAKFTINTKNRKSLKIHHTATHILHAVLRDILGKHVIQKGSLVAHNKLRFDISHSKPITKAEIQLIEKKVNSIINDNEKVNTNLMSTDEAIKSGAMALFGEKYDNQVRVVSFGNKENKGNPYSFELCGGTHVDRTGDIGMFKITNETAVAAGVRRIEAICNDVAFDYILADQQLIQHIMQHLKSSKNDLLDKLTLLSSSKKSLEKQVEQLQIEQLSLSGDQLKQQLLPINAGFLFYREISKIDSKIIRISAEQFTKKYDDLVLVHILKDTAKLSIIVAVSDALSSKYNAGQIAKELSSFIGGSGGGQAKFAQAGGSDISKLPQLKEQIIKILSNSNILC